MKRTRFLTALLLTFALVIGTSALSLSFAASGPEPTRYNDGDGMYTIDITVTGGDGSEVLHSPATLNVDDTKAYAIITWDSPTYQTLTLEGKTFQNSGNEKNSRFEIPVTAFDEPMTIVMDDDTEYQITFDKSSISSSIMMWIMVAGTTLFIAFVIFTRFRILKKQTRGRRSPFRK